MAHYTDLIFIDKQDAADFIMFHLDDDGWVVVPKDKKFGVEHLQDLNEGDEFWTVRNYIDGDARSHRIFEHCKTIQDEGFEYLLDDEEVVY